MKEEEKLIRIALLEEERKRIEQYLLLLEQHIAELQLLHLNLDEIKKAKDQEILALLGKNVFLKAKIISNDIYVDVGAKTVIKKNIEETKKIIEKELSKFTELRDKMMLEFNFLIREIAKETAKEGENP